MSALLLVCSLLSVGISRKPFAKPEPGEKLEYLLRRKPAGEARPDFEAHAFEHVLSYQRRIHALKTNFMKKDERTPLGVIRDWWDRTEAQMRAALHGHILCWFRRRKQPKPEGY